MPKPAAAVDALPSLRPVISAVLPRLARSLSSPRISTVASLENELDVANRPLPRQHDVACEQRRAGRTVALECHDAPESRPASRSMSGLETPEGALARSAAVAVVVIGRAEEPAAFDAREAERAGASARDANEPGDPKLFVRRLGAVRRRERLIRLGQAPLPNLVAPLAGSFLGGDAVEQDDAVEMLGGGHADLACEDVGCDEGRLAKQWVAVAAGATPAFFDDVIGVLRDAGGATRDLLARTPRLFELVQGSRSPRARRGHRNPHE